MLDAADERVYTSRIADEIGNECCKYTPPQSALFKLSEASLEQPTLLV